MNSNYKYPNCDQSFILNVIYQSYERASVAAAIELGLFDLLAEKNLTRNEIVDKLNVEKTKGESLIILLAACGYLKIIDNECYLSEVSKTYLISTSPFSMKQYFIEPFNNVLDFKRTTKLLIDALKAEKHSFVSTGKIPYEEAKIITNYMHTQSLCGAIYLAENVDFYKKFNVDTILDIAGGSGCYAIAIAKMQSNVKCTVLEYPDTTLITEEYLQEGNVDKTRVDIIEGDYRYKPYPKGYKGHLYCNIFIGLQEDLRIKLIKKSFDSLEDNGYIFIHDALSNENEDGPVSSAYLSFIISLDCSTKLYNFKHIKKLLMDAGYRNIGQLLTHDDYSLVYAQK